MAFRVDVNKGPLTLTHDRSLLSMYCDVWGRLGDVVWTEPTYVHFLMDLHRLPSYCINTACTLELWKELQ